MRISLLILVALLAPIFLAAQETYFPPHSFSSIQKWDSSEANQNVRMLQLLGEPSLFAESKSSGAEVYRFLWLRSFNHPVSVRLDVSADGTGLLTTTVAPGSAGFPYTCKGPLQIVTRTLTQEQVQSFRALVQSVAFWSISPTIKNDQTGTDGSEWLIEGIKDGRYHLVHRWSPTDTPGLGKDAVRKLGLALAVDLGQLPIEKEDIY